MCRLLEEAGSKGKVRLDRVKDQQMMPILKEIRNLDILEDAKKNPQDILIIYSENH